MLPDSIYTDGHPTNISLDMIDVEGGEFDMGSEHESVWGREDPIHRVKVDSFSISPYPITQAIWKAVMGTDNNPSYFQGDGRPVETVSWEDCQEFIKKLNQVTGKIYRLPTEAEWEYAARGGQKRGGYLYAGSNKLEEVAWHDENSDGETKVVGQKQPNELGIYDMSGNVWEWCQDYFEEDYYEACSKQGLVKNPQGPKKGDSRVFRGGGWYSNSEFCRSSDRNSYSPEYRLNYLGFRLVLSPSLG